jgi:protein O-GlcNAc transferase
MRTNTLQDSVNELMMLHAMGRFTDMEQRARVFLKSFAGAPILCEFLGLALAGQHRYNDALSFFQRAARGDPDDPQFWENLANCQLQIGDLAETESSLRQALALDSSSIRALTALAGVLCSLKRNDEARGLAERALAIAPSDPAARYQLGRILAGQSDLVQAERHLRLALAAGPNVAAVHNELGNVLRQKGALTEAEASLRRAIDLDPASPSGFANLGLVLIALRRNHEAAAAAHAALDLRGNIGSNLSDADCDLMDIIASVFDDADRGIEAINVYKTTLNFRPDPLRALWATHAARRACDWDLASALEPVACRVSEPGTNIDDSAPWRLLSLASATAALQLAAARKCAQVILGSQSPVIRRPATSVRARSKLRVGYFSGDLHDHPIAHLISGVIEAHDRNEFEIVGYDFCPPASDEYRSRLVRTFDRLVPIGELSNQAASQQIADDEADIIIDIGGWTMGSRPAVLAPRPAALQVQWLGYPGTLGAPWIDYIVADDVLIPASDELNFSEKIIRLPDTYQPSDDKRSVGQTLNRQDYGLPDDAVVFCSFNQIYKVTPEIFDIWINLLGAIDHSVLWLREPQAVAAEALRNRLAMRGLDSGRLVFAPLVAAASEHRARIAQADVALDCFPYGSHTTASDILWAGVPLVALIGETYAARASASVLTAAGLPELITRSLDDYQRLALRLASDREELVRLKQRVQDRRRSAALFDTARFTRNLEKAFIAIWERHLSGLAPDHVTIA